MASEGKQRKAPRFGRLSLVAAVLVAGFGTGALVSAPSADAAAANGSAWVVAPKWWGWCAGWGNSVRSVHVQNHTTGTQSHGWAGADKVRIPVRRGTTNNVQVNVTCSRSFPHGIYHRLSVDRDGRTFFVGYPSGVHRQ